MQHSRAYPITVMILIFYVIQTFFVRKNIAIIRTFVLTPTNTIILPTYLCKYIAYMP